MNPLARLSNKHEFDHQSMEEAIVSTRNSEMYASPLYIDSTRLIESLAPPDAMRAASDAAYLRDLLGLGGPEIEMLTYQGPIENQVLSRAITEKTPSLQGRARRAVLELQRHGYHIETNMGSRQWWCRAGLRVDVYFGVASLKPDAKSGLRIYSPYGEIDCFLRFDSPDLTSMIKHGGRVPEAPSPFRTYNIPRPHDS